MISSQDDAAGHSTRLSTPSTRACGHVRFRNTNPGSDGPTAIAGNCGDGLGDILRVLYSSASCAHRTAAASCRRGALPLGARGRQHQRCTDIGRAASARGACPSVLLTSAKSMFVCVLPCRVTTVATGWTSAVGPFKHEGHAIVSLGGLPRRASLCTQCLAAQGVCFEWLHLPCSQQQ